MADYSGGTLYRILDARTKNPTQLDTIEKIASAYNLQAWQLLVPRLDPLDPPVPMGGQRMSVLQSVFAQTHAAATTQPSHDFGAGFGARDTGHRARPGRAPADGAAPAPGPKRRPKGRARNKTHS